jgi:transposase
VRLVFESARPIAHVARDLGGRAYAPRKRVRRAEFYAGKREGLSSDKREEHKRLHAEVFELRRANSILKETSVYFARQLDANGRRERVHQSGTRSLRVEQISRTLVSHRPRTTSGLR